MSTKIVFILPSLSQPRSIKRIHSLYDAGFCVEVCGFDRGVYNVNRINSKIQINILGKLDNGRSYIRRFFFYVKVFISLLRKYKNDDVVYYVEGLDLSFFVHLFSNKPYVYEVADIKYTYFNRFVERVFKLLEMSVIKRSLFTIVITKGFLDYYGRLFKDKLIVIPNKVNVYFNTIERPKVRKVGSGLKFGFVGLFRYPNTIFRFARIIGERYPQHEFFFYGDSDLTPDVIVLSDTYSNVFYKGTFKNPDDLRVIYDSFDILVACYDVTNFNIKTAEPNKFYESLFFNKPIIVSNNTYLSEVVNRDKIGFSINAANDEDIIHFLDNLDCSIVNELTRNISLMNKSLLVDDPEVLVNCLNEKLYS